MTEAERQRIIENVITDCGPLVAALGEPLLVVPYSGD